MQNYDRRRETVQYDDAAERAETAQDFADHRLGRDVTVADGNHGDDSVPKRVGYAAKLRLLSVHALDVVQEAGEEDDHYHQAHAERAQLPAAIVNGAPENLQSSVIPRDLQEPQRLGDANYANDDESVDPPVILDGHFRVERKYGDEVEQTARTSPNSERTRAEGGTRL